MPLSNCGLDFMFVHKYGMLLRNISNVHTPKAQCLALANDEFYQPK